MGKALIDGSPLFTHVIRECDRVLASLPDPPSWSVLEELQKNKDEISVHIVEYSQPLCTALQLGLLAVLNSWGLKPDAVVGHSSGEIAAAHAGGFISLRDAIVNAYYRGLVSSRGPCESKPTPAKGAMCAVGVSEDEARQLLQNFADRIQLAAVNSPKSCTLSGDRQAIEELVDIEREVFVRGLRLDVGM